MLAVKTEMTSIHPVRPPAVSSHSTSEAVPTGSEITPAGRPRASTLQISTKPVPATIGLIYPATADHGRTPADIFDSLVEEDDRITEKLKDAASPMSPQPQTIEDLPIEIRSLTERFLHSLTAKTYPSPLGIDAIAELYQDFYMQAESHVATHIAAQATLLSRASSSKATSPVKDAPASRLVSRTSSIDDVSVGSGSEQQMLTAAEIADKKRARRHLEKQKDNLDEAVERVVCEKLYDRIYRHRSGDDEERDAKLRSKTAALNLLGIGLKELHVDVQASKLAGAGDVATTINEYLGPARESIRKMDDERHPLGKLQHLKTAHKGIVETLANLFPSSSSADEVLPTLIYTLITSQPETINVVSNLHFVQLFRAASRVDGETAYCLVNLEAAISFLETVDLSSLNTDQSIDQPSRPSDALTLLTGENPLMASSESLPLPPPNSTNTATSTGKNDASASKPPAGPTPGHQRRLSSIIQNQRDNIANTADQAFESINTTLESSIKFLFGRLQQEHNSPAHKSPVTMPKTLDEARQLISTPTPEDQEDSSPDSQAVRISPASITTVSAGSDPLRAPEAKLMDVFAGRRVLRDRSVDSRASTSSGGTKHVSFATKEAAAAADKTASVDAPGSFVSSLNPLSRFSVPSFPRFGRSTSGPQPATPPIGTNNGTPEKAAKEMTEPEMRPGSARSEVDLNAREALAILRDAEPVQRFMDINDANDLKLGEVQALLVEYQRLAGIIRKATL